MRFFVVALVAVFTTGLSRSADADTVTLPPLPPNIETPAGHRPFLVAHAVGTQNYLCAPSGSAVTWTFIGPQATLFKANAHQIVTHFLSPNPSEGDVPRATWQHSRDTSAVWARAIATSADPNFVAPGAIPWLLLEVVGADPGPIGGRTLIPTTYIQRLNTVGGVAPSTGCTTASDVNKRAFVPYEAVYAFYRIHGRRDR